MNALNWTKRTIEQIKNDKLNRRIPEKKGFVIIFNKYYKVLDIQYDYLNTIYSHINRKMYKHTTYAIYDDYDNNEILENLRLCSYHNDKYEDAIKKVNFPYDIRRQYLIKFENINNAINAFDILINKIDKNNLKNKLIMIVIENENTKFYGILITTLYHLDIEFKIAELLNNYNCLPTINLPYNIHKNYRYGNIKELHI